MKKISEFLKKHFELSMIFLIIIGILAIAFLVYYKIAFLNFFFIPVILSGYFLGQKNAVLTGVFCAALVILYMIYSKVFFGLKVEFSIDETITTISWASFLIITGAIIGRLSEQREAKIEKMRRSYMGALKIILKYLEVADERKPRSLRVSLLSGKIAKAAGLSTTEVENIKSAALLYEAGDLKSSLPFFEEIADFTKSDLKVSKTQTVDREQVLLSTTASLLRTIEPLLFGYFLHYVKEADNPDKDLNEIPKGSSIIALADLYDKISTRVPAFLGKKEIKSLEDIEKLSRRSFSDSVVRALKEAIKSP